MKQTNRFMSDMLDFEQPENAGDVLCRALIPVYTDVVQCTDEMDLTKSERLVFNDIYTWFSNSALGRVTR